VLADQAPVARVLLIQSSLTLQALLEIELEQHGHTIVDEGRSDARVDLELVESSYPRSLARAHALVERDPDVPIVTISPGKPTEDLPALRPRLHLEYPFSAEQLGHAVSHASRR